MTDVKGSLPSPVTVIVPVYGSGPNLDRVVGALQQQEPAVAGIVLSHSGAGDPSKRFGDKDGITVLHSRKRLFAGAARNRGLEFAKTDWVAFIDEDVIVDRDWHKALLNAIAKNDADCILGSIGYADKGGYWGMSLWFTEFSSVHPYRAPGPIPSGASANLSTKRRLIASIGGFPEMLETGEDSALQARLEIAGYRIWLEPKVVGRHVNLPGFRRVLRHSSRLGRSSARHRSIYRHLRGAAAVRWPLLSLGMWVARFIQICYRVQTRSHSPKLSLIWHTPGILICLLAWNVGFTRSSFKS